MESPALTSHGFAVAVMLGAPFTWNCRAAGIAVRVIAVHVIAFHVSLVEFQSGDAAHVSDLLAVKRFHAAEIVAFFQVFHALIALAVANANANASVNAPVLNAPRYALVVAVVVVAVQKSVVVTPANYVSSIHANLVEAQFHSMAFHS